MRLLFLDQFNEVAGAQCALLDLLPALRERGWQAHLAAPGDGPLHRAARDCGATAQSICCGPYHSGGKSAGDLLRFAGDFLRLRRDIADIAARTGANLIYVNGPRLLPAAAWAARGRIPILFHCHSHLSQRYAAALVGRSLGRAGAAVVACSRFVAEPLRAFVKREDLRVIYCGTRECRVERAAPRPRGRWRIGVVGRIAPQKGQAEFLRAARIVLRSVQDCQFVVCGSPLFGASGYFAEVRRLAEALPVEFLPWQDDVRSVLASLDLLVVPSTVPEGAPKVILEAYSAGVPVVAFRSGGVPEIVANSVTGFLVEPPAPETLAATLLDVLRLGPGELERVAEAGRALWSERFTLARYQQEVLDFAGQVSRQTASAAA